MSTRIVVCDDESHIRRAISMKLTKGGFAVEAAPDGQAAWEAVCRETPAMVVTDYQMPRMDGLTLCRQLRSERHSGWHRTAGSGSARRRTGRPPDVGLTRETGW